MRLALPVLAALPLAACTFNEELEIYDLRGTVVLPEEAATRTVTIDGVETEITDVRLIGPVVLGLYPSVRKGALEYTSPEAGPVFQSDLPGDAYPYGGTTLGDIRFACLSALTCKVASGRFVDFDALVGWFQDTVGEPLTDQYGNAVTNGDALRQACYAIGRFTSDEEVRLTATEDKNLDGHIDERDLDFVQRNDGKFEAEFTIWQQEYFADEDCEGDGCGFALWGWMDAPSDASYQFSTCDPTDGQTEATYAADFYGGRQYRDLLNFPANYISSGDYVATEGWVYDSPLDEGVTIELDYRVVGF